MLNETHLCHLGRLAVAAATLAGIVAGCGDGTSLSDASQSGRQLLLEDLTSPDIGLKTAGKRLLRIRYVTAEGVAIGGHPVTFSIEGSPRGATLSDSIVSTSAEGLATVEIRAGAAETSFQVQIQAEAARSVLVYVQVSNAGFASISVKAGYDGSLLQTVNRVEYHLYGGLQCTSLLPSSPSPALRERTSNALSTEVVFQAIALDQNLSLLALAYDGDRRLRGSACADIPARLTSEDLTLELELRIENLAPRLAGRYELTTTWQLPPSVRTLADALRQWGALSDCPLGPAQWLLDCILDARDGDDPLDCHIEAPSPQTQAIMAMRGTLAAGCRGATHDGGGQSLEALLAAQQETGGGSEQLAALRTVEARGKAMLSEFTLHSDLTLSPLDGLWRTYATHALREVQFESDAAKTTVDLARVAIPLRQSGAILATASGWQLMLSTHRLGLRFGVIARQAFGELVLQADDALPAQSHDVVSMLINLATKQGGGCTAFDKLVCTSARLLPGCLADACTAGGAALSRKLDAGFSALDSLAPQLTLAGGATLTDSAGDLAVDMIGSASAPGKWTTALLTLDGQDIAAQSATFTGQATE